MLHYKQFILFLNKDLALSKNLIAVAQRSVEQTQELLMIPWQCSLVTLKKLEQIL